MALCNYGQKNGAIVAFEESGDNWLCVLCQNMTFVIWIDDQRHLPFRNTYAII